MKKILVIGGSGVLGSNIVKFLIEKNINVEFTYLKNKPTFGNGIHLDITQKQNVEKLIIKTNPNIVIHTTAVANVDLCETNTILADQVNVEGTKNITDACKKIKCKIVYISTPFVFDGNKQQYTEEDKPSPATYYGKTKFIGEEITKNANIPHMILRTDQPYGWIEKYQHTNSVLRVIETLSAKKILREVTDWYNVPTYVPDFVETTWKLLSDDCEGIFHVVGSKYINRYEWSLKVAEIFKLDKNLICPILSDELNLPAKRVNVNLCNKKVQKQTGIQMSNIEQGLIKMIRTKEK